LKGSSEIQRQINSTFPRAAAMKSVDAHENRDAPSIDFVDTGCPAFLQ
jgi:hypothetical protein